MIRTDNLPVVAIIGRPNVGKSSLFNLLLGEKKSIVDEMEGVTRDINKGVVKTGRKVFTLLDTAGYMEKGDRFNKLVQDKIREAIDGTELILFMVDGRNPHPYDEDIARLLLKSMKNVIVIANKIDNKEMESFSDQFYHLGFNVIVPFSVVHKRGYNMLIEMIEDNIKNTGPAAEQAEEIKVSIVGRPNVGKSMLLNRLLGYERSLVSEVPGTTRDSLDDLFEYKGRNIRLIDTAGLRRKSKISGNVEYYSNVRTAQAIERSDVVIELLDAGETFSQQDRKIIEMVIDKGRSLVLAFNKWDIKKSGTDEDYRQMEDMRKAIYKDIGIYNYVPVEFISAKDGYHIDKLMGTMLKVYADFTYRVPTAILNEWLEREIRESDLQKPVSNLKIYYATQAFTAPPKFIFFINKKEFLKKDFPRHIERKLREAFEFSGTPVRLVFKPKEREMEKKD